MATTEMAPRRENEFLSTAMTPAEIVGQVKLIQEVMASVMQEGEHYGVVPGTKKTSLWKSGAEKLCMVFRLAPMFESTREYDGKHLTVTSRCTLVHTPTGRAVGSGEGICSTKEKKYAWRKDGGKVVENGELPDLYNTIIKMANKRAHVAATLTATAASDIFTQDMGKDDDDKPDGDKKEEPKKVDAVVKEPKKAEEKAPKKPAPVEPTSGTFRGKIVSVDDLVLPGGRAAWAINTAHNTYKTTDKRYAELSRECIPTQREVVIAHHRNGNGSDVIDSITLAELAVAG
jgi:hypothetical protein